MRRWDNGEARQCGGALPSKATNDNSDERQSSGALPNKRITATNDNPAEPCRSNGKEPHQFVGVALRNQPSSFRERSTAVAHCAACPFVHFVGPPLDCRSPLLLFSSIVIPRCCSSARLSFPAVALQLDRRSPRLLVPSGYRSQLSPFRSIGVPAAGYCFRYTIVYPGFASTNEVSSIAAT